MPAFILFLTRTILGLHGSLGRRIALGHGDVHHLGLGQAAHSCPGRSAYRLRTCCTGGIDGLVLNLSRLVPLLDSLALFLRTSLTPRRSALLSFLLAQCAALSAGS
jgi:hypothetical protein